MENSLTLKVPETASLPVVRDLWTTFLQKRSAHTRRAYAADLAAFASFIAAQSPAAALDVLIQAGPARANHAALQWRDDMLRRGLSTATRNRHLAALRSALKLGRTLGLLNWTLELEGEKGQAYRDTRGPGEESYQRMLKAANARDAAILRLLHDLALRRGEVVGLDLADLDLETGRLGVLGKGRDEKMLLTVPGTTLATLRAWLQERGDAPGALFTAQAQPYTGHRLTGEAVRAIVNGCAKRAAVGKVRPHGLRHTAITTALERTNGNISAVARFSRHASVETVRVYDDARLDVAGKVAALVAESA